MNASGWSSGVIIMLLHLPWIHLQAVIKIHTSQRPPQTVIRTPIPS